jgi:hypothetical protein
MISPNIYTTEPIQTSEYVWTYNQERSRSQKLQATSFFIPTINHAAIDGKCDYTHVKLSDSRLVGFDAQVQNYFEMNEAFKNVAKEHYSEARNTFLKLADIANILPLKSFFIDYTTITSTVDIRILLKNGLRIALSKPIETEDDDMVAFTISFKGQTLAIDITDSQTFKSCIQDIISELAYGHELVS